MQWKDSVQYANVAKESGSKAAAEARRAACFFCAISASV